MNKKYTLWIKPYELWTPVLDGIEFTDEVQTVMEKAITELDETSFEERLKSYNTPVTSFTMDLY